MGMLLGFIALLAILIIGIPCFLLGCIIEIQDLNGYFGRTAKAFDELGNVICAPLFNLILINRKSKCKFGIVGDTISEVLGKNKRDKTCTNFGLFWCMFLNKLEPNHVEKSIDNN